MLWVCCLSCPVLSCPVCLSCLYVCLSVTLVYCGQTVGQIKMKLGMQIGLGPGHIVLDGDPAPSPPRGGRSPTIFGPYLLWPNCWMNQMPLGMEVRLGPGDLVFQLPPKKGGGVPLPNFRPMSIVPKCLDGSRWHLIWR